MSEESVGGRNGGVKVDKTKRPFRVRARNLRCVIPTNETSLGGSQKQPQQQQQGQQPQGGGQQQGLLFSHNHSDGGPPAPEPVPDSDRVRQEMVRLAQRLPPSKRSIRGSLNLDEVTERRLQNDLLVFVPLKVMGVWVCFAAIVFVVGTLITVAMYDQWHEPGQRGDAERCWSFAFLGVYVGLIFTLGIHILQVHGRPLTHLATGAILLLGVVDYSLRAAEVVPIGRCSDGQPIVYEELVDNVATSTLVFLVTNTLAFKQSDLPWIVGAGVFLTTTLSLEWSSQHATLHTMEHVLLSLSTACAAVFIALQYAVVGAFVRHRQALRATDPLQYHELAMRLALAVILALYVSTNIALAWIGPVTDVDTMYILRGCTNTLLKCWAIAFLSFPHMEELRPAALLRQLELSRNTADMGRKQFIRYVFHELRVPMNTLHLGTVALEDETDAMSANGLDALKELRAACDRVTEILNDVLTFQKIQEKRFVLEPQLASFADLLTSVVDRYVPLAERSNIHLFSLCEDKLGSVKVMMDSARVAQVIGNLITNAIRFSKATAAWPKRVALTAVVLDSSDGPSSVRGLPKERLEPASSRLMRISSESTASGLGQQTGNGRGSKDKQQQTETQDDSSRAAKEQGERGGGGGVGGGSGSALGAVVKEGDEEGSSLSSSSKGHGSEQGSGLQLTSSPRDGGQVSRVGQSRAEESSHVARDNSGTPPCSPKSAGSHSDASEQGDTGNDVGRRDKRDHKRKHTHNRKRKDRRCDQGTDRDKGLALQMNDGRHNHAQEGIPLPEEQQTAWRHQFAMSHAGLGSLSSYNSGMLAAASASSSSPKERMSPSRQGFAGSKWVASLSSFLRRAVGGTKGVSEPGHDLTRTKRLHRAGGGSSRMFALMRTLETCESEWQRTRREQAGGPTLNLHSDPRRVLVNTGSGRIELNNAPSAHTIASGGVFVSGPEDDEQHLQVYLAPGHVLADSQVERQVRSQIRHRAQRLLHSNAASFTVNHNEPRSTRVYPTAGGGSPVVAGSGGGGGSAPPRQQGQPQNPKQQQQCEGPAGLSPFLGSLLGANGNATHNNGENRGTPRVGQDTTDMYARARLATETAVATFSEKQILVIVHDEGDGIDPEDIPQLFVPFSVLRSGDGSVRKGSGLGLAVCRKIIDLHGGTIGAVSQLGIGSRFFFAIPYEAVAAEAPWSGPDRRTLDPEDDMGTSSPNPDEGAQGRSAGGSQDRASSRTPHTNLSRSGSGLFALPGPMSMQKLPAVQAVPNTRVLVVDDVTSNRKLVMMTLAKMGVSVSGACNGVECLEMVQDDINAFQLILLDAEMPVMGGYETAERLRRMNYRGGLVGLTGHTLDEDMDRFTAAGADQVLIKPLDHSILISALLQLKICVHAKQAPSAKGGHRVLSTLRLAPGTAPGNSDGNNS